MFVSCPPTVGNYPCTRMNWSELRIAPVSAVGRDFLCVPKFLAINAENLAMAEEAESNRIALRSRPGNGFAEAHAATS